VKWGKEGGERKVGRRAAKQRLLDEAFETLDRTDGNIEHEEE
jgi:hypothetical protein